MWKVKNICYNSYSKSLKSNVEMPMTKLGKHGFKKKIWLIINDKKGGAEEQKTEVAKRK